MSARAAIKLDDSITLRELAPSDSAALSILNRQTPDTGAVAFYAEFHHDMYETLSALRENMVGVVAEATDYDGIVGMGLVSFGECMFEGELRPFAYLSSLGVHQDYRRRGIASRLAQWRVDLTGKRFKELGKEGVIFAGVQGGNTGSLLAAAKWSNQHLKGRSRLGLAKVSNKSPSRVSGLEVRLARPGDFEEIADKQNSFYQDYNLYRPQTAGVLREWCSTLVFGEPIHQYFVVVDASDNIVAGCGVTEYGRLISDHVVRMPPPLRAANLILRMIPPDGVNRRLSVDQIWFEDGNAQAGRFLWESLRWILREHGNILMTFYDPQSPLRDAIKLPKFMPSTDGSIVLNAPVQARVDHLVYFQA